LLSQFAATLVMPPTAVPVSAASAEMAEASMGNSQAVIGELLMASASA
jgi:hypothetical protein